MLVGNVDCSQVLPVGAPEELTEAAKACIRTASPRGGHFIGFSSEIVSATPVDNILTFYETAWTCGRFRERGVLVPTGSWFVPPDAKNGEDRVARMGVSCAR